MSRKSEEQIKFLKQFKNPVTKLFAYIFKYRMKEFLIFIIAALLALAYDGKLQSGLKWIMSLVPGGE